MSGIDIENRQSENAHRWHTAWADRNPPPYSMPFFMASFRKKVYAGRLFLSRFAPTVPRRLRNGTPAPIAGGNIPRAAKRAIEMQRFSGRPSVYRSSPPYSRCGAYAQRYMPG
jgi:hypothetical protein